MSLRRLPVPLLRPFVADVWIARSIAPADERAPSAIEHVLPCGAMHLAIRLDDLPVHLFDEDSVEGRDVGHSVLGGARAGFYAKASGGSRWTIGAQLRPGAARALFGVGAAELANRHTRLDELWGPAVVTLRDRLRPAQMPAQQLDLLETFLAARLPRVQGVHPAVAQALHDFAGGADVGTAVANSGYSHRRFIEVFDDAVGLTPKRYCRVRRFQSLLKRSCIYPDVPWVELAHDAGYSDQSHFVREFRQFAGVTPDAYRRLSLPHRNHVPVVAPPLRSSLAGW